MSAYIARRLLLIAPTLFAIMVINFLVAQAAPGGPVEQLVAQIKGQAVGATERISGSSGGDSVQASGNDGSRQTQVRGLDPQVIEDIKKLYGFDKPAHERFFSMIGDYLRFDFGDSFFRDRAVIDLIKDALPVSISLGLWSTLFIYLISIPLGIAKAVYDGSRFDVWSSALIIIGYSIPPFLLAIALIVLFAGGSYWDLFPLRGLVSSNFESLSTMQKILDYLWHLCLPITAMTISGFATLSMLTKNAFLDEVNKQYVATARAKGNTELGVLFGHVFRNAMLIIIAGFPAALIAMLFTSSLLIEIIFSIDGLGLLAFEAVVNRDYPVMFGTLYIFTLIGLLTQLINDLAYVVVDPRIDFEARGG